MQNQNSTLALQTVSSQIAHWRSNKKSSSEHMPDELRTLIANLVPTYPIHDISKILKIKPTTINFFYKKYSSSGHFNNVPNKNDNNKQNIDFIPIQLSSLFTTKQPDISEDYNINTAANASSECQIIKANGTKLIIHIHDVSAVIKSFLCSN